MAGRMMRSLVENVDGQISNMFGALMDIVLPLALGSGTSEQVSTCTRCLGSLSQTNKMMERVTEVRTELSG